MRIVLLMPKLHPGSEITLNELVRKDNFNIVGIVRSDISPMRKSYWKYLVYGVRKAGLFYGALIALAAYLHWVGIAISTLLFCRRRKKWLSIRQIKKKYHINVYDIKNINSEKSVKLLKSMNPDVLITLNFDQILKKQVLEIPKRAALNMHPGLLPKYRGLWPDFWSLLNGEKYAGVSIHYLNERIDAGEVIGQTKYPIRKTDSKFTLGLKAATKGSKLLIQTLQKLKKGAKIKPLIVKGKPKYYSLPKKIDFDNFFANDKKMFSFVAILKQIKTLI